MLGEPHPDWLRPFEHGPLRAPRRDPRGGASRDCSPCASAGRSRSATTRRSPPGTGSRWPRSPRPVRGSAATGLRRGAPSPSPSSCSGRSRTSAAGCFARTGRATPRIPGYLEDYANVANGLVELSWATGDLRWLEEARRLAGLLVELFARPRARRLLRRRARGRRPRRRAGRSSTTTRPPPGTRWRPSCSSASRESTATRAGAAGGRRLPARAPADGARPGRRLAPPLRPRPPLLPPQEIAVVGDVSRAPPAPPSRAIARTPSSRSRPEPTDDRAAARRQGPGGRQARRVRLRELRLPAAGHGRGRAAGAARSARATRGRRRGRRAERLRRR